ncbi:MAG: family ATPase [Paenibacillus sp.]|jgi:cellulose biosynthesis protein BcsQ|nr:family ATPase [Paenibacillus sp.]
MSEKLNLVIADRDTGYMALLADYIRETEWSKRLSVRQVTKPETLREHVRSQSAQLYLAHPDFDFGEHAGGCRIRLYETKQEAADPAAVTGIYKYQPLHQLLGKMFELYRQLSAASGSNTDKDAAAVYSVFSASGGVGKTTISIQLARAFAENGDRCLYWNMELVPGTYMPKEADAELTARFVYGLRANAPWTGDCLPGILSRAEPYGFDYFSGFVKAKEALDLTRDDVLKLVEYVKRTGRYDVIVFDLDATIHDRAIAALTGSDEILWIVTEDGESSARTFRLLAQLDQWQGKGGSPDVQRIRFVMNKHTGYAGNALSTDGMSDHRAAPISAKLPYVPGWKHAHGANRTTPEPLFYAGIAKLASDVRVGRGGGPGDYRSDNKIAARAYP